MTSQQQLLCDNSTLANFVQWASAISNFFRTAGWINSADTGQLDGAGAGNWSSVAAVPGSGAYYYEIFEPNDGLANFYVKMEYGNVSGSTNCPAIRVSIGTGTNAAGTLTGYFTAAQPVCGNSYTPNSTTQYECNFSGAPGRIGIMMWRNGVTNAQQFVAIERSISASGAYTGTYATMLTAGNAGNQAGRGVTQGSIVFGVGVGPNNWNNSSNSIYAGWTVRLHYPFSGTSSFDGGIPFDTPSPSVGYFDYPMTAAGVVNNGDIVEAVQFQATLYGAVHTFLPTKTGPFAYVGPLGDNASALGAICMRFD